MKTNILFSILAVLLFSSCQTDSTSDNNSDAAQGYMPFSAGVAATRTEAIVQDGKLLFHWKERDEVGIYGTLNDKILGCNYAYKALPDAENAARCVFRASTPGEAYQYVAAGSTFYAYYPYNESADSSPLTSFPIVLPAEQWQSAVNSPDHIAQYGFMSALPVRTDNPSVGANFNFRHLFSIVELRLKMSTSSLLENVPIKQIRLTSGATDIAILQGTTDLTSESQRIEITEGSKTIVMNFEQNISLTKSDGSFYFLVAPGNHADQDITMEITAIDNSVNTVTLPGAVVFESNRHYVKPVELALEDFHVTDEFDVTPTTLTCKAGDEVDFAFTGIADKIVFWSGEAGHEYQYATQGKLVEATVNMNFSSIYINGMQRKCATVRYSTDFSGQYTEAAINAAKWTEVSSQFQLPPHISVSSGAQIDEEANPITEPYNSGTVDITSWFSDYQTPVYFAFFYHVDIFDANFVDEKTGLKGNGRTWFQIYTVQSESCYPNETPVPLISVAGKEQEQINVINGASYAAGKDTNLCVKGVSSGGTTVVRMQATFKPTSTRDAWAITNAIYRPKKKHAAPDTGESLLQANAPMPEKHTHIFTKVGTYTTTVVATITTMAGEETIEKEFTITVN